MKKLGFGFMRLPVLDNEDRTKIDYETVNKMVDLFMENGFTYFDTAKVYHDGFSEIAVGKCLADRYPRESFRLTDKLCLWVVDSPDKMQEFFNGQLEACHVDYFDNYLIHNMGVKTYKQAKDYDAFNFVRKLKEQGKVKEYGFSFHDNAELLDTILTEQPDVDYVQLQVNYMDWNNSGIQSRKCCEVASKHGKKIIIMEPVKGGTLANVPNKAAELLSDAGGLIADAKLLHDELEAFYVAAMNFKLADGFFEEIIFHKPCLPLYSEIFFSVFNVCVYLRFKRINAVKFLFVSQAFQKLYFNLSVVQIAVKPDNIGLAINNRAVLNRWA